MKKKFTEAQIVFALREAESGTPIAEIIRKIEISEVTFYRYSVLGNATPEEYAAQVEPQKATLERGLEAVKNGLAYSKSFG